MLAKRMALSLLAIGVTSLVVSAATFALFTAQTTNQNNTFTAGTVTLGAPAGFGMNYGPLAPGDTGSMNLDVQYTGNLEAWIGLDAALSGDLMTCDGGKFSVTIGGQTLNAATPSVTNVVVGKRNQNDMINLPGGYNFDISAGNDCQGDVAQLNVIVKAVQARNNTNGAGTGPVAWN